MILSNVVIEDLKEKSGLLFDQAKDFDLLSKMILKSTQRSIGITTLKRLTGYINDDHRTNSYTLNTIALYLGYRNWDEYLTKLSVASIWGYQDMAIYVSSLKIGTVVIVKYLDRKIRFKIITYEGIKALMVEEACNSSLQPNDILVVHKLEKGKVLEAEKVFRRNLIGNYKTSSELTYVEII